MAASTDKFRPFIPRRPAATPAAWVNERVSNMERLERIVARLPEAVRVDIEARDGEPTFRVRGKNFVFTNPETSHIAVKLSHAEAAAVVAADPLVKPMTYGLGRHGWVSVSITTRTSAARRREIEEWIRTSYTLVAPKKPARLVREQDRTSDAR
jgi:predicted DNA-binding protein (MmcQ/YjbR family)